MAYDGNEAPGLPEVPKAVLLAWGVAPPTTKGPKPRWTLEQLLDTAVRLGDEHGLEGVSMSGLAKALGSGTMSLYRYVESREDLVVLTADHALGPGAAPDGATWRDRLRAWVADLRRAYERHPWLTTIPVETEPLLPAYLRRLDRGLQCLAPSGISPTRAITVLTMLWTYTRSDVEQSAHLAGLAAGTSPVEVNRLIATRLRGLVGDRVPRVLAALENPADPGVEEDEFNAAIDIVLRGLAPDGPQRDTAPGTRVVVASDREIPERAPITISPGDRVEVGERDTTWPSFVFVTAASGSGWVPERHLDHERPTATVVSAYDTRELPAAAGEHLTVVADDPESGWTWCTNAAGRAGWIPHSALS